MIVSNDPKKLPKNDVDNDWFTLDDSLTIKTTDKNYKDKGDYIIGVFPYVIPDKPGGDSFEFDIIVNIG